MRFGRSVLLVPVLALVSAGGCLVNGSVPDEGSGNPSAGGASGGFTVVGGTGGGGSPGPAQGGMSGGSAPGGNGGTNGGAPNGGASTGGTPSTGTGGTFEVPSDGHTFYPKLSINLKEFATQAYTTFKTNYVMPCGNGQIRVASNGEETVSEGIAYGMLLAVAHDDRATFDGIWAYYKARRKPDTGVMHWKYQACTQTVWGQNGATDAEVDAAMALVQAECKWKGYRADATELVGRIKQFETEAGSPSILKPGDAYGGTGCLNPSYFAPAYYRVFAKLVPADAAFWNKLADDTYGLISAADNDQTGLVPDWSDVSGRAGGSQCTGEHAARQGYGYDAARTPWRIATDFVWFGTPAAKTWLTKVATFASGVGFANIRDGYNLNGTLQAGERYHNSTFAGAFALASLGHSQELSNTFHLGFAGVPAFNDAMYFHAALRAIYLLLPTGMFAPGCAL